MSHWKVPDSIVLDDHNRNDVYGEEGLRHRNLPPDAAAEECSQTGHMILLQTVLMFAARFPDFRRSTGRFPNHSIRQWRAERE